MFSRPRLRPWGAATAILLMAQLGLASLPAAHADEPGPGSLETTTWVDSDKPEVELGDTVTLRAGAGSDDGPVSEGSITFFVGTHVSPGPDTEGEVTLVTSPEGIPVTESGEAEVAFTFSDEWFADHTDSSIVPSELSFFSIVAAYTPPPGSSLLPSLSMPQPLFVSGAGGPGDGFPGGPGGPGDGFPGGPGGGFPGGPGGPGDGFPGFPGDGPGEPGGPGGPGEPGEGSGGAGAAVTVLSASSATVQPGGEVTFTVSVGDVNGPRTGGMLYLLANSDPESVFNCAGTCSTLLATAAPDASGSATFTVRLDDATFVAKGSAIRPSSGEPVFFGVRYSFGSGLGAEQGQGNMVSVSVREGSSEPVPPVLPPVVSTTVVSVDRATPVYGDQVTFTARVTADGKPVTTGAVVLHAGGTRLTPEQGVSLDASGTATFTAGWDAAWFAANTSGDVRPEVGVPLGVSAAYLPAEAPAGGTTFAPSTSGSTPVTARAIETVMALVHTSGSLEHGATATFTVILPGDVKGTLNVTCPDGTCVASRAVSGTSSFEVQLKNTTFAEAARTVSASFISDNPRYSDASASTTVSVKNAPVKLAFHGGSAGSAPTIAISAASVPSSITVRITPSLGTPVTASYAVDPVTSIAQISYPFVEGLPHTIEASLGGATGKWSHTIPIQGALTGQGSANHVEPVKSFELMNITGSLNLLGQEISSTLLLRFNIVFGDATGNWAADWLTPALLAEEKFEAHGSLVTVRATDLLFPRSSAGTLLSTGAAKSAQQSADTTTVKGTCEVKKAGLSCDFGFVPAGSQFSYTIGVPVPAAAAGKTLTATTTATATDPFTGEVTVLSKKTTTHKVAKRTVFTGSLKAAKKSVKRGKKATVTAKLTNAGVITASKVSSCVTTPKGVKISKAKGAKITKGKTKACWTVKSLKAKKSASFKVTFTAPKKKGTTTVAWTVKPQKSQADGFTLKRAIKVA